jgi:hypothetical protein
MVDMLSEKLSTFEIRGNKFLIDIAFESQLGIYGAPFWEKVNDGSYEPVTFNFIDEINRIGFDNFIDIGSATGCMSLYAGALGMKVLAVEPQLQVFNALERNLKLNPKAAKNIQTEFALVVGRASGDSFEVAFTDGASGPLERDGLATNTFMLKDLADILPINSLTGIKIDIEGAEFPIFSNPANLEFLVKHKPVIYLALHPGFRHPLPINAGYFSKLNWKIIALLDVINFYRSTHQNVWLERASDQKRVGLSMLIFSLFRDEKDYILKFKP